MALKPTNDPLAVMRRAADAERRETNAALEAGGTQPEQVVRKLRATVEQQGILLDQIIELFNRMPLNDGRQVDQSGWSIDSPAATGAWTTVATAEINRPANMNRVAVSCVGTASATSQNVYESAMQARILVNGAASVPREGTIEQLAAVVRSSVNLGFFHEVSPLTTKLTVELQLRGRYKDFLPTNTASLTVSAGFSKVGS